MLKSPRSWLWLLAALTLLLHLAAGLYIGERHFVGSDAGAYEIIARNLLAGNGFDCNGYKAWYAPLYPLLLTVPFGLTAYPFTLTVCAQGLLVVGIQWLGWRLTLLLGGRPWAGVLAAALIALDPLTFYYSILLLTETLFTFLALVFLWLLVEAGTKPRGAAFWLLAGAVLGAATLTRPVMQAFFIICVCGRIYYGDRPWRRRLAEMLVVGMVAAAVMAPWVVRNYRLFHKYVPGTIVSGYALYAGNNPLNHLGGGLGGGIDYDLALVPGHATLGEAELNAELTRHALAYIREQPLHFVRMIPVKLARAWSPLPSDTSGHNKWYEMLVSFAWCLPVFPLFLVGLWSARATWRVAWPLYAWLAYMTVFIAVYFGTLRFRLPLHPLLAVWAALGAQHWLTAIRAPARPAA